MGIARYGREGGYRAVLLGHFLEQCVQERHPHRGAAARSHRPADESRRNRPDFHRPRKSGGDDSLPGPFHLRDRPVPQTLPDAGARRSRPYIGERQSNHRLRDASGAGHDLAHAGNQHRGLSAGSRNTFERPDMTDFNDRKRGEEAKFAMDEQTAFRVAARRNRLLGGWAAEKMNLTPEETDAYRKAVIQADFEE